MKRFQRFVIPGLLALALLGAILALTNGFSLLPLSIGLMAGAAIGLRAVTLKLDSSGHAAAIRERARANWELAKGRSPKA